MKINKSIFLSGGIIILLFLIQSVFYACPKCDQDFYNQLMEQRGNILGKEELLKAIKNQTLPGETSPFGQPESYNSETDIIKSGIEDSTNIKCNYVENNNSETVSYFTYIIIFTQLNFIEGL